MYERPHGLLASAHLSKNRPGEVALCVPVGALFRIENQYPMNNLKENSESVCTNDIRAEYQRLVDLASTPSGWKEIEREWRTATNVKFIEGKVLSRGESNATVVKGFAIDPVTKQCMTSCATYHSRAYMDMVDWITKNEPDEDLDVVMSRPIKGWIGTILDFESPCILMGDTRLFSDRALLETLEEAILDQEVGLPLNKLYFENH